MSKYLITIQGETERALMMYARNNNIPVEELISRILNKYITNEHNMNREDMGKGYVSCGDINLSIANITNDLTKQDK